MTRLKRKSIKMNVGNLVLAICLSTVPTAITYGILSLHGLNICKTLETKVLNNSELVVKNHCEEAVSITTKSYIFLIGFFITLPTWLWIYLSMRKKTRTWYKIKALKQRLNSKTIQSDPITPEGIKRHALFLDFLYNST